MWWLPVIFAFCTLRLFGGPAPVKIVASFTVIKDFVKNIGGDRVVVSSIVGPNGDPHSYTPTPSDVKRLSEADIVFVNGLHLDSWMGKLISSAGKGDSVVEVTRGIKPRMVQEEHGVVCDPHAWHNPENALVYVKNITEALCLIDPEYADSYRKNSECYMLKILQMHSRLKALFATIPLRYRVVLTAHEGFGYFGLAYDIRFFAPMGMSTEEEARPRDMAFLITTVQSLGIHTLFAESISNDKVVQQIAKEGNATVGEVLYSDSLSTECGDAPTYIAMLEHNARYVYESMVSMQRTAEASRCSNA